MTSRQLRILLMAQITVAALSLAGCAVNEGAPAEFSFERITISNPLADGDEDWR